jgi:hypothetical protein
MKLNDNDIAYLKLGANQRGYNSDDLLRVINYESGGRPDVWGGKGGNYFGLFQAGGPERIKYGIDTKNPNARNQIDALFSFMKDRGFKPGMGLMDLYSTVNAGSPGHYNASDGNGTVASHVAKMSGQQSTPGFSLAYAPEAENMPAGPLSIESIIQQTEPVKKMPTTIAGLLEQLDEPNKQADEPDYNEEMKQQMMNLHNRVHEASLQGLLGRN